MLRFLRPRWLALHVFVVACCVGMVFAGRWQWRVAQAHHDDIRNIAYAVQWYVFVAFALWFWAKVMRDTSRRAAVAASPRPDATAPTVVTSTPPYRGYAMPQSAAITVTDPELARYNAYLGALADEPSPSEGPVRTEGLNHQ